MPLPNKYEFVKDPIQMVSTPYQILLILTVTIKNDNNKLIQRNNCRNNINNANIKVEKLEQQQQRKNELKTKKKSKGDARLNGQRSLWINKHRRHEKIYSGVP